MPQVSSGVTDADETAAEAIARERLLPQDVGPMKMLGAEPRRLVGARARRGDAGRARSPSTGRPAISASMADRRAADTKVFGENANRYGLLQLQTEARVGAEGRAGNFESHSLSDGGC